MQPVWHFRIYGIFIISKISFPEKTGIFLYVQICSIYFIVIITIYFLINLESYVYLVQIQYNYQE